MNEVLTGGSPAIEPAPPFSIRVAAGPIDSAVPTGNDNRPPLSRMRAETEVVAAAAAAVVAAVAAVIRQPNPRKPDPPEHSHPLIPFATDRRGPAGRCICRTWSVARYS